MILAFNFNFIPRE